MFGKGFSAGIDFDVIMLYLSNHKNHFESETSSRCFCTNTISFCFVQLLIDLDLIDSATVQLGKAFLIHMLLQDNSKNTAKEINITS